MEKLKLMEGKYYFGICDKTTIAMWNGNRFFFFEQKLGDFNIKEIEYSSTQSENGFLPIKIINGENYFKNKNNEYYFKNKEQNIKNEIWKKIPDFENVYEASNYGRIRRIKDFKVMSQSLSGGYLILGLTNCKKRKNFRVHRLIAMSFLICNDDEKKEVDHKNSDKLDNRVENLEWVTREENARRIYRTHGKKFSLEFINKIKLELKKGCKMQKEISKEFGISETMVSEIKNNNKWKS